MDEHHPAAPRRVDPLHVEKMLDEARAELAHADTKAAFVLTTIGIGLALGVTNLPPPDLADEGLSLRTATALLSYLAGAVAVASAALVVWPRAQRSGRRGYVVFWGDVEPGTSADELLEAMSARSTDRDGRAADQLVNISRVLGRKYLYSKVAIASGLASGALLAISAAVRWF